jgi:hypothetical protein
VHIWCNHGCIAHLRGVWMDWNHTKFIRILSKGGSTWRCVEWTFGILKGRWQIILKKADVPLQHMADIIWTYIVLHNICIGKDGFDQGWMKEVEKELQRWVDEETLRERQELKGERLAIVEVKVKIHHNTRRRMW